MTVDREWLLADAMRLEDAQPDHQKGLWLVGRALCQCRLVDMPEHCIGGPHEQVILVEALTAPGARAVLETLELVGPDADLSFAGPIDRRAWRGLDFLEWYDEETVEGWMNRHDT